MSLCIPRLARFSRLTASTPSAFPCIQNYRGSEWSTALLKPESNGSPKNKSQPESSASGATHPTTVI